MNPPSAHTRSTRLFITLLIIASLGLPALAVDATTARPLQVEVVLEEPTLHPPAGACDETYWYAIENDRGHTAYLTLNVFDAIDSSNWAEWLPNLPEAGYYRVEAYIAAHDPITWCTGDPPREIADDTTDARYTIRHAFGETSVARSQAPLANEWLDLGEYYFNAGSGGAVRLTDLNGEPEFSTTVSFSAMRFTWTREPPYLNRLPAIPRNVLSTAPESWVDVLAAPAFDVCHLGTNSIPTMQAWWTSSPYRSVGVYLGGISYYEGCSIFTADWIAQARPMGWSFIPIWVGPQAPCSKWENKMADDPAVTYLQGRTEADLAAQAARALGLTNYDLGGTIIYYDLEAYGPADDACKLAVGAFLNGWTERLHELNNRSGIYGGSCSSYATTWTTLTNPPDNVWLAYWDGDEYNPDETVFGIPCFADTLYANHQRLNQYAGSHDETWGGKTLEIDCDVTDGEVAVPEITLRTEATTLTDAIQQAGWLSAQRGWLVSAGGLYQTEDGGRSWQRQAPQGVERAHLLTNGEAWAAGTGKLYQRTSWSGSWRAIPLPAEVSGWRTVQAGFEASGRGWLVLQQPTSAIFSVGKLLRTADAGLTWQTEDLPIAEPLTWTDARTAWLSGGVAGNELYRSLDGGQRWAKSREAGIHLRALGAARLLVPLVHAGIDHVLAVRLADGREGDFVDPNRPRALPEIHRQLDAAQRS